MQTSYDFLRAGQYHSTSNLTPGITRRDGRLACGRLATKATLFAVGCMPLLDGARGKEQTPVKSQQSQVMIFYIGE